MLTRTFPPELVDRVTARTGAGEQRRRLLPARVVVYYTLAMCLFAQVDPDRLSFIRSLHIARRQVTGQAAFPLGGWPGRPGWRSLNYCGTCCPAPAARLAAGGQVQDEQLPTQAGPPSPLATAD